MTYPPQQPPYGQDPYGQPDPYGQDPYGQQPPPWGGTQPGGFPVGPPPKKSRTGLTVTLIVLAVLIVGGGGVGAYLLLSKEDKSGDDTGGKHTTADGGDARAATDKFVGEFETILNTEPRDVDLEPVKPLLCSSDYGDLQDEVDDAKDDEEPATETTGDAEAKLSVEDFEAGKTEGSFTLVREGDRDKRTDMRLEKSEEGWQVCGLYEREQNPEDSPSSSNNTGIPPNPVPTT